MGDEDARGWACRIGWSYPSPLAPLPQGERGTRARMDDVAVRAWPEVGARVLDPAATAAAVRDGDGSSCAGRRVDAGGDCAGGDDLSADAEGAAVRGDGQARH